MGYTAKNVKFNWLFNNQRITPDFLLQVGKLPKSWLPPKVGILRKQRKQRKLCKLRNGAVCSLVKVSKISVFMVQFSCFPVFQGERISVVQQLVKPCVFLQGFFGSPLADWAG